MGVENIELVGIGEFVDVSANYGQITQGIFADAAYNYGMVLTTAEFNNNSVNNGTVLSAAFFHDQATNNGFLSSDAKFEDSSVNNGLISVSAACDGAATVAPKTSARGRARAIPRFINVFIYPPEVDFG